MRGATSIIFTFGVNSARAWSVLAFAEIRAASSINSSDPDREFRALHDPFGLIRGVAVLLVRHLIRGR